MVTQREKARRIKIAKQHYGNGESWSKIAEANVGKIAKQVILP